LGEKLGFVLRLTKENKTEVKEGRKKDMKSAKIGAIFLVSVIAIAGISAGYAWWTEDLVISGTVTTGTFGWYMTLWGDSLYGDYKDIVTHGAELRDYDQDGTHPKSIYFWANNMYPCVNYYIYFNIECTGSIPVHFTPFDISTDLPADSYDFEVTSDSGVPLDQAQLHYGDSMWFTLRIHFNNNIEENTNYVFDLYTMAHQYNENPP
jgi:hypothetical protein